VDLCFPLYYQPGVSCGKGRYLDIPGGMDGRKSFAFVELWQFLLVFLDFPPPIVPTVPTFNVYVDVGRCVRYAYVVTYVGR
jgi:hypothetical protein